MKIVNKITLLFFAAATAVAPLHGGLGLKKFYHKLIGYREPTLTEKIYAGARTVAQNVVTIAKKYPKTTIAASVIAGAAAGYETYKSYKWYQLTQKCQPPIELRELIEKHKELILTTIKNDKKPDGVRDDSSVVGTIEGIPGYYIKQDTSRVVNAEWMNDCIIQHNLSLLGVATKYIYKVNGNWLVFAKEVQGEPTYPPLSCYNEEPAADTEKGQIKKLQKETEYWDMHSGNWRRTPDGKLVCIDTENISFLWYRRRQMYKAAILGEGIFAVYWLAFLAGSLKALHNLGVLHQLGIMPQK